MVSPAIAVLMTCHNRRALTERCLRTLIGQAHFDDANLFLVDDGSTDGTGDEVKALCRHANVISADGSLFWNGGMRLAWDVARERGGFDYYLWLNDDVVLRDGALEALVDDIETAGLAGKPVIMIGSTVSPGTTTISYGGQRAPSRSRPLRLDLIEPEDRPVPLDSFSGNVVLVSAQAERIVGNLSPAFEHIYGDIDYGFRARRAGVPVLLSTGISGECALNDNKGSSLDTGLGLVHRFLVRLREENKVHARDWRRFTRMHSGLGPLSFLYSLSPYIRLIVGPPLSGRLKLARPLHSDVAASRRGSADAARQSVD